MAVRGPLAGLALVFSTCWAAPTNAQTPPDDILSFPDCDRLIDDSYDRLSNPEKAARLTSYGGCWKRKTEQLLQRRYRDVSTELRNFQSSAMRQANTQVRELGSTASQVMRTRHQEEIAAHRADYKNRSAALNATSNQDNYREVAMARNELTEEQRASWSALQSQQKTESTQLAEDIRNSYVFVEQRVDEIVREEQESLATQLAEKLEIIGREFKYIATGSIGKSINEEMLSDPVGEVSAVSGNVRIVRRDGSEILAQRNSPIYFGDAVETGGSGSVTLQFMDDAEVSLVGTDPRWTVDDSSYDPRTTYVKSTLGIRLLEFVGSFNHRHEVIETPLGGAGIGIRG